MVVKIQEIVGVGGVDGEGEYEKSGGPDSFSRLVKHIEFLADYALEKHKALLMTQFDESQDQHDIDELITRLTLNEFSLYPNDEPLSLSEYDVLSEKVKEIANKLSPNVHLVLGTLPVLKENVLHNVALYVESPRIVDGIKSSPRIREVDKTTSSPFDKRYQKKPEKNLCYPLFDKRDTKKNDENKNKKINKFISAENKYITHKGQYGNVIKITTQSGIKILAAVDICLMQEHGIGFKKASKFLRRLNEHRKFMPTLGTHVVISNVIDIDPKWLIAKPIHADPDCFDRDFIHHEHLTDVIFGKTLDLYTYTPQEVRKLGDSARDRIRKMQVM